MDEDPGVGILPRVVRPGKQPISISIVRCEGNRFPVVEDVTI
jgi:hypothetical protein